MRRIVKFLKILTDRILMCWEASADQYSVFLAWSGNDKKEYQDINKDMDKLIAKNKKPDEKVSQSKYIFNL